MDLPSFLILEQSITTIGDFKIKILKPSFINWWNRTIFIDISTQEINVTTIKTNNLCRFISSKCVYIRKIVCSTVATLVKLHNVQVSPSLSCWHGHFTVDTICYQKQAYLLVIRFQILQQIKQTKGTVITTDFIQST